MSLSLKQNKAKMCEFYNYHHRHHHHQQQQQHCYRHQPPPQQQQPKTTTNLHVKRKFRFYFLHIPSLLLQLRVDYSFWSAAFTRLVTAHMVATNLCIWFRTLVFESMHLIEHHGSESAHDEHNENLAGLVSQATTVTCKRSVKNWDHL